MKGGLWNPPRPPIAHRQEPTTPKELFVPSSRPRGPHPRGTFHPVLLGSLQGSSPHGGGGRAVALPPSPARRARSARGPQASQAAIAAASAPRSPLFFPVARRHRAAPACTAGARASALERARGSLKCCPVGYRGQCGRGYGHLRFPEPRVWAGQTLGIVLFLVVEGQPTWKLHQQAVPRQLLARRLALDSQTLGCFCVLPTAGLSQNLCRWLPNCHFLPRLR